MSASDATPAPNSTSMTRASTTSNAANKDLDRPTQTESDNTPVDPTGQPKGPPTQSSSSTAAPKGDGDVNPTPDKADADGSDASKDDGGGGDDDDDDSGVLVIVIIVVVAVACLAITGLMAYVRQQQNQTSRVLGSLAASRKDTLAARGSSSGTAAAAAAARRANDTNKRVVHNAAFDEAAARVAGTGVGDVDYHDRVLPDDDGDYHDMVLPDAPAHAGGRTGKGSGTAALAPPQRSTRSQVSADRRMNSALSGTCRPPFCAWRFAPVATTYALVRAVQTVLASTFALLRRVD